jgi:hypothetical protein
VALTYTTIAGVLSSSCHIATRPQNAQRNASRAKTISCQALYWGKTLLNATLSSSQCSPKFPQPNLVENPTTSPPEPPASVSAPSGPMPKHHALSTPRIINSSWQSVVILTWIPGVEVYWGQYRSRRTSARESAICQSASKRGWTGRLG